MLTSSSIFSASSSSLFWGACRRTLTVVPLPFLSPHTLFAAATIFSFRSYRRLNQKDHWWAPKAKIVLPRGSQGDAFSTEKSVSADGYNTSWFTKYSRLLPCPSHNTAPRIEHLVVFEEGNVLDYISKALQLPSLYVADLIHFGAIHYALVCPRPPPSATAEQVQIYRKVTEPSVLRKRSSLNGKTVREAQKTHRITDANEFVEVGTYLRVHVHPKRYPRCYEVDWKSRIIAVTDSYVVLDKPAATSVGGSSDNIEETCATFTSRVLGLGTPLKTTHQLDNCTEGCLVLAKTKEFCSAFHEWIRVKQVKKLYLALTAAPVPTGILSHYMRPVNLAPRLVSREYIEGWHLCQLEVLECKEVPWPKVQVVKSHSIEDCGWPSKKTAYECKINLLTGKTHQVRAQLAAIGSPIVGDSMYMPAAMAEISDPRLNPFGVLGSAECLGDDDRAAAMSGWISCHGKEPNSAIGLQASEISWNHGECAYQAGVPCWVDTDGLFS